MKESFKFESLLRHRVGRRCTLLLSGDSGKVLLKAYRDNESPMHSFNAMAALEKGRVGHDDAVRGARVLAYDWNLHFIATEWFDGPSGSGLIESHRGARAGRLGAQWLSEVHVDAVHFAPVKGRVVPLRRAAEKVATIARVSRDWGEKAAAVLECLQARCVAEPEEVLCHGSFKPEHIFDLGAGPGLVDWDSAKTGPPELDGGAFLGKLSMLRIDRPACAGEVQRARHSFLQGTSHLLQKQTLQWYEAFALLKGAGTACRLQGLKAEKVAVALLDEAARLLDREAAG